MKVPEHREAEDRDDNDTATDQQQFLHEVSQSEKREVQQRVTVTPVSVGDVIRSAREAKGLSQRGLAALARVSEKQIYNVEDGANTSIDFLSKLATILDIREIPIAPTVRLHSSAPAVIFHAGLEIVDVSPRMVGKRIEAIISAGPNGWSGQNGDGGGDGEMVMLPAYACGPEDFLVRARGESLLDEGIGDGDVLVVRRMDTATPGELVIAWLNDGLVIKRFVRREGKRFLESAERSWLPLEIKPTDVFEIHGIIRIVLKPITPRGGES